MKQTSYIPTPGSAYMTMQNDYSQSTIAMDDSQAKLKNLRNSSDETRQMNTSKSMFGMKASPLRRGQSRFNTSDEGHMEYKVFGAGGNQAKSRMDLKLDECMSAENEET